MSLNGFVSTCIAYSIGKIKLKSLVISKLYIVTYASRFGNLEKFGNIMRCKYYWTIYICICLCVSLWCVDE